MVSFKAYPTDGTTNRFLSEAIIKGEEFCRVYAFRYDKDALPAVVDKLEDEAKPFKYPTNLYLRNTQAPKPEDQIAIDRWDLVDNSIVFYEKPRLGVVYIEVASTKEELGSTILRTSDMERFRNEAEAFATSAGTSATNAGTASTSANASAINAQNSAGVATAQAGIATTQAQASEASAVRAEQASQNITAGVGASVADLATVKADLEAKDATLLSAIQANAGISATIKAHDDAQDVKIDANTAKAHTHSNKGLLDKLSIEGGKLKYDNTFVHTDGGTTKIFHYDTEAEYTTASNAGVFANDLDYIVDVTTRDKVKFHDGATNTEWYVPKKLGAEVITFATYNDYITALGDGTIDTTKDNIIIITDIDAVVAIDGANGTPKFIKGNTPDAVAPVITILGDNPYTVQGLGTAYVDAGATATDNIDGDITANITVVNPVDVNIVGSYNVVYTVTDNAGHTTTATRVVQVIDTKASVVVYSLNPNEIISVSSMETTDGQGCLTSNDDGATWTTVGSEITSAKDYSTSDTGKLMFKTKTPTAGFKAVRFVNSINLNRITELKFNHNDVSLRSLVWNCPQFAKPSNVVEDGLPPFEDFMPHVTNFGWATGQNAHLEKMFHDPAKVLDLTRSVSIGGMYRNWSTNLKHIQPLNAPVATEGVYYAQNIRNVETVGHHNFPKIDNLNQAFSYVGRDAPNPVVFADAEWNIPDLVQSPLCFREARAKNLPKFIVGSAVVNMRDAWLDIITNDIGGYKFTASPALGNDNLLFGPLGIAHGVIIRDFTNMMLDNTLCYKSAGVFNSGVIQYPDKNLTLKDTAMADIGVTIYNKMSTTNAEAVSNAKGMRLYTDPATTIALDGTVTNPIQYAEYMAGGVMVKATIENNVITSVVAI